MFKRFLFVLALVLLSAPAFAQAVPNVNSLRWETVSSDIEPQFGVSVDRFEVCYDARPACDVFTVAASRLENPTAEQGGPPAAGSWAFSGLVPALMPKQDHKVFVRACNSVRCGPPSETLTFPVELGMPGQPGRMLFIPRPGL